MTRHRAIHFIFARFQFHKKRLGFTRIQLAHALLDPVSLDLKVMQLLAGVGDFKSRAPAGTVLGMSILYSDSLTSIVAAVELVCAVAAGVRLQPAAQTNIPIAKAPKSFRFLYILITCILLISCQPVSAGLPSADTGLWVFANATAAFHATLHPWSPN